MHAADNQLPDNLNNDGGLLSSVLLFLMLFTFKRWLEAEAYSLSPTGIVCVYGTVQLKYVRENADLFSLIFAHVPIAQLRILT